MKRTDDEVRIPPPWHLEWEDRGFTFEEIERMKVDEQAIDFYQKMVDCAKAEGKTILAEYLLNHQTFEKELNMKGEENERY